MDGNIRNFLSHRCLDCLECNIYLCVRRTFIRNTNHSELPLYCKCQHELLMLLNANKQ